MLYDIHAVSILDPSILSVESIHVHLFHCKKAFQPEDLWSNLLFNEKVNVNVLDCDLFCNDSSR